MPDYDDSSIPPPCAKCGSPLGGVRACTSCGHTQGACIIWQQGDQVSLYELVERIDGGKGGMGQVWRVCQQDDRSIMHALKLLRSDRQQLQIDSFFLRERQLLISISHTNIARILQTGTAGGQPYFVMELVECQGSSATDPKDLVSYANRCNLSIEARLRLFKKVCDAAHYLHQNGIVHRDLKPDNVLVSDNGSVTEPKIIDLGVAKRMEQPDAGEAAPGVTNIDLTQRGQYVGTLTYSAPEQLRSPSSATAVSDVYSLGVLLLRLLTGRLPMHADEAQYHAQIQTGGDRQAAEERLLASLRDRPRPRVGELTDTLHPDLRAVLDMALRHEVQRRYSSAAKLSDDIEHYLRGEPVAAWQLPLAWVPASVQNSAYTALRFVQRHTATTTATFIAFATLLIGGVIVWSLQDTTAKALVDKLAAQTQAIAAAEATSKAQSRALQEAQDKEKAQAETLAAQASLAKTNQQLNTTVEDLQQLNTKLSDSEAKAKKNAAIAEAQADLAKTNQKKAETAQRAESRTLSQSHFTTAIHYIASNQAAEAIAFLVRALRTDPSNAEARTRLATLLLQRTWAFPRPLEVIGKSFTSEASIGRGGKVLLKVGGRTLRPLLNDTDAFDRDWHPEVVAKLLRGDAVPKSDGSTTGWADDSNNPLQQITLSPDGRMAMMLNSILFGSYRGMSEATGQQVNVVDVASGLCCDHGQLNSKYLVDVDRRVGEILKEEEVASLLSRPPFEVRLRTRNLAADSVIWAGFSPNSELYAQVWSSGWVTIHRRVDMNELTRQWNLIREDGGWSTYGRPSMPKDEPKYQWPEAFHPGYTSWLALEPFPIDLTKAHGFAFSHGSRCFVALDEQRQALAVWHLGAKAAVISVQYWKQPLWPQRRIGHEDESIEDNGTDSAVFDPASKTIYGLVARAVGSSDEVRDTILAVNVIDGSEAWALPLTKLVTPLRSQGLRSNTALGTLWRGDANTLVVTACPSWHQDTPNDDFKGIISVHLPERTATVHLAQAKVALDEGQFQLGIHPFIPIWQLEQNQLVIDFHDPHTLQLTQSVRVPNKAPFGRPKEIGGAIVSPTGRYAAVMAAPAIDKPQVLVVWDTLSGQMQTWRFKGGGFSGDLLGIDETTMTLTILDHETGRRLMPLNELSGKETIVDMATLAYAPWSTSVHWQVLPDDEVDLASSAIRLVSRTHPGQCRLLAGQRSDAFERETANKAHIDESLGLVMIESEWKGFDTNYTNWSRYELDDGARFYCLNAKSEAADVIRVNGGFRHATLDSSGWFWGTSYNHECVLFRFPAGDAVVPDALLDAAEALAGLTLDDSLNLIHTQDAVRKLNNALAVAVTLPPTDYWTQLLQWIATPPEDRSAAPWTTVKPAQR